MPSVIALEKMTMKFEDSWIKQFSAVGKTINKVINISSLMTLGNHRGLEYFNNHLRAISRLLREVDLEFGYLYDEELYTGALIHDEGVCNVFKRHASKVYDLLQKHGVKRVITVDPHTTDMLRSVYPKIIDRYHIEVKNYLELLVEMDITPKRQFNHDVVIHDSCVYARYENIIEEPRLLLERAGFKITEPDYSKKLTYCCGGPIESLFPKKSRMIAENRINQLIDKSKNIITMCPICLINLQNAAIGKEVSLHDISHYLFDAYCHEHLIE
jgi:Fe-S oxidoreductase